MIENQEPKAEEKESVAAMCERHRRENKDWLRDSLDGWGGMVVSALMITFLFFAIAALLSSPGPR
jgi:hypothetical protein